MARVGVRGLVTAETFKLWGITLQHEMKHWTVSYSFISKVVGYNFFRGGGILRFKGAYLSEHNSNIYLRTWGHILETS